MYQALYRKWRPQTFDDVVDQKQITETLKNQVKTGHLSHAYIFIGTRGTGKTTCARILAKAVNCENPVDGNPCGHCAACRSISAGEAVDIVELDAASNNGVENVRALREEAMFSPSELKKRVYIIDEVHMLSNSAFNALLKILEEPPEHLMFILATTELQKVPATILSRCQRHSFTRLSLDSLTDYIQYISEHESFTIEPDAAELIARLAEGGARDAISLLDQCSAAEHITLDTVYSVMGLAGSKRTVELFDYIINHDTDGALSCFAGLWQEGKDPVSLLTELSSMLRDVMLVKLAPRGAKALISGTIDGRTLRGLADRMTSEELIAALGTIQHSLADMRGIKNTRTAVELCLVSLADNTLGESVNDLRARISRLEQQIKSGIPVVAVPQVRASQAQAPREEVPASIEYHEAVPQIIETKPERPLVQETPAPEMLEEEIPVEEYYPESAEEPAPVYVDNTADEDHEDTIEVYQEEQPEDAFVAKRSETPIEEEFYSEAELTWANLRDTVKPKLPMPVRIWVDDDSRFNGHYENGVFDIYVGGDFYIHRIKEEKIKSLFSDAASAICGKEVNIRVLPLSENAGRERSIEELKQFPEVKFI